MRNSLRFERARKGLSQEELAQKVGVSRQTIYAIETGRFEPSGVLLLKLAEVLEVKVEQLFYLEDGDWSF